jgi:hypothetical protein
MNGSQFMKEDLTASDIRNPSDTILIAESQISDATVNLIDIKLEGMNKPTDNALYLQPPYGYEIFTHTSDGRANWLFCDDSVRSLRFARTLLPHLMWLDLDDSPASQSYSSQYGGQIAAMLPPRWR